MRLANLAVLIPDAAVDLRYASAKNITGKVISGALTTPQLEEKAALALVRAAEAFRACGLRVVLWDAYRPPEVHQRLLAVEQDRKFVLEDSNHCRGLAVDMTLANGETGQVLDMGTDHDDFTPKAHPLSGRLTDKQRANQTLLIAVMEEAGFTVWPYEWWHFDFTANPGYLRYN